MNFRRTGNAVVTVVDAYQQLRSSRRKNWREDWLFYEDQKESRKVYMTNIDHELVRAEQRVLQKKLEQKKQIEIFRQPAKTVTLESDSEKSGKGNDEDEFELGQLNSELPCIQRIRILKTSTFGFMKISPPNGC